MYLEFYGLRETPFGITPDPDYLFLSPSHGEALASLIYGVRKRKGFITITGEVGSGKTTVLRAFLARLEEVRVQTVYLFNPELTFPEVLKAIFEELGLGECETEPAAAVRRLHQRLIECYEQNVHVVLIVDEAQRMPMETLERLRILSNLETAKDKLLQIVLCGQPEFDEMLLERALRQLRERVAVCSHIRMLTRGESVAYVQHRIARASLGPAPVFTPGALSLIARFARGNPRIINIVCDNALIAGFADGIRPVPARVVREVTAGFNSRTVQRVYKSAAVWTAGGVGVLLGALTAAVVAQERAQDLATTPALISSMTQSTPVSYHVAPPGAVTPEKGEKAVVQGPAANAFDLDAAADRVAQSLGLEPDAANR